MDCRQQHDTCGKEAVRHEPFVPDPFARARWRRLPRTDGNNAAPCRSPRRPIVSRAACRLKDTLRRRGTCLRPQETIPAPPEKGHNLASAKSCVDNGGQNGQVLEMHLINGFMTLGGVFLIQTEYPYTDLKGVTVSFPMICWISLILAI